ncbi:hypothetical protein ACQPXH_02245 [Nocardia sp. CA-135953]
MIAAFQNTQRENVTERISFLYDPTTRPATERCGGRNHAVSKATHSG